MHVQFGGEEHSGWLPPGATKPLPTPIENVILDLEIEATEGSFILCWSSNDGLYSGDNWYEQLNDVVAAASDLFGVEPSQWSE